MVASTRDIRRVAEDADTARWDNEGGAIPPDISRANAVGDLEETAVKRTVTDTLKEAHGSANPTQQAIDQLPLHSQEKT